VLKKNQIKLIMLNKKISYVIIKYGHLILYIGHQSQTQQGSQIEDQKGYYVNVQHSLVVSDHINGIL